MSDFVGYARTNLFEVADLNKFREELAAKPWEVSLLSHETLAGFIWTGTGMPFEGVDLKELAKFLAGHIKEAVFIIVGGASRGTAPVLECTVIEPNGKMNRSTLADIIKGRSVDLSDAPVIWKP